MRTRRTSPVAVILATALTLSFAFSPAVRATSPGEHGEGKAAHFEVPLPETKDAAVKLLETSLAKITGGLAALDFAAIHEATYSLESAVARIAKEPGFDGLTSSVAPRVEIVHLASELEDADTLKAAVPALEKAIGGAMILKK